MVPQPQRVFITGIGLLSPFGKGIAPFWEALTNNQSAIRPVTRFPTDGLPCRVAGCFPDSFQLQQEMSPLDLKRMEAPGALCDNGRGPL